MGNAHNWTDPVQAKFDQDLKALQAISDAWYQVAICEDLAMCHSSEGTAYYAMRTAWATAIEAVFPDEVEKRPNLAEELRFNIVESDLKVAEALALAYAPPRWYGLLPGFARRF